MIVVLVGPTAVGKSALAVALADRLSRSGRPAEIVNADSMLLYRGMDIGTAKPGPADRERVRHHLIDVLDVTETATVADFQALARAAVADCLGRGVTPLLVGGSALYVRAVVDEFDFPGTDPEVRARLETELDATGPQALHQRLAEIDPAAAAVMEPANGRRIVRALEVIELTGRPYRATLPDHRYALPDVRQLGLDAPRDVLDERITDRVARMWRAGFVAEVQGLIGQGLQQGVTANRALGYRQILSALAGEISEDEARAQTVLGTRKFARRQGGWFRRDPRIGWLTGSPDRALDSLLDQALRLLGIGEGTEPGRASDVEN